MLYKRHPKYFLTDTMHAVTVSKSLNISHNLVGHVLFQMKKNSEYHEGLLLIFHIYDVTITMIMYGSKEKTLGTFCSNLKWNICTMNNTDT